jgi:hypothetical protein
MQICPLESWRPNAQNAGQIYVLIDCSDPLLMELGRMLPPRE